jgi:hypothetical protein
MTLLSSLINAPLSEILKDAGTLTSTLQASENDVEAQKSFIDKLDVLLTEGGPAVTTFASAVDPAIGVPLTLALQLVTTGFGLLTHIHQQAIQPKGS